MAKLIEMSGGVLYIKTAAAADNIMKITWASVSKLAINHPIPFHLKEGTVLIGTATEGPNGTINVRAEPLKGTMEVPLESITALNPIVQAPVIYSGTLTGGYSQATGNSHLRNGSLLGDFVAGSEQLRLTLNGRYVYGDKDNELSARNARGLIKMDFFLSPNVCSGARPPTLRRIPFRTSNCEPPFPPVPAVSSSTEAITKVLGSKTSRSMPRPGLPT